MIKQTIFASLLGLGFATAALAQTTPPPDSGADPSIGAYDRLPSGGQKIAQSLFDAQTVTATGPAPMSLDQIAYAKGGEPGSGWGNVFKQMQSDGLIQARNLGQLVSGHYSPPGAEPVVVAAPADTSSAAAAKVSGGTATKSTGNSKVHITTASGRTIAVGRSGKSGAAKGLDGGAVTTATGGKAGVQTGGGGKSTVSHGKGFSGNGSGGITTAASSSAGGNGGAGAGRALGHSK